MKKILIAVLILFCSLGKTYAQNKTNDTRGEEEGTIKWNLNSCIVYAIENNLSVKRAILDREGAIVGYKQSVNDRLPNLSGEIIQEYSGGSNADPYTGNYVKSDTYRTSFSASSQVVLFNGGKINKQIKQNKLQMERSDFFVNQTQNDIILEVLQQYIESVYYKESVETAENTFNTSKKELEQARLKFEKGAIAKKDVADMEAQYANDEYKVLQEKNNFEQRIFAIKQLLEIDPRIDFDVIAPELENFEEKMIPTKEVIYKLAISNLPEVRMRQLDRDIKEKSIAIAKSDYLPTLSVTGRLSSNYLTPYKQIAGPAYDDFGNPIPDPNDPNNILYNRKQVEFDKQIDKNLQKQAYATLQIPIFNKFATKAAVNKAKIEAEQAKLDYYIGNKELYKKIETVWLNYTSNLGETKALFAGREASKLSFELAQIKYEYGDLSITDLLISQKNYISAEQQYLQSKYMGLLYYQLIQYYQGNKVSF